MNKFFIITRKLEKNREKVELLQNIIKELGGESDYIESPPDESKEDVSVPEGTECIITVGGDGTLIGAARTTGKSGVPLIGMNRGHLGYLCEFGEENAKDAIARLIRDEFETEKRMMIEGFIEDENGNISNRAVSLNDIVITAGNNLSVVRLTVCVNGKYLYSYLCDGMIFSTPTGSTAYNLSANGPIVDPKTSVILLTPINAHTLNSRSIVLDKDDEVTVELEKRRSTKKETGLVRFDGKNVKEIALGEKLHVRKADEETKIIMLQKMNFLERMSKKLQAD